MDKTKKAKKSPKFLIVVVCVLIIIWLSIFIINYFRCSSLKHPIFVISGETADDGGSGFYYGLGYKVKIKKYIDVEYGTRLSSVEMYMFGKVISASIE